MYFVKHLGPCCEKKAHFVPIKAYMEHKKEKFKLAMRNSSVSKPEVSINEIVFGDIPVIIPGPCAIESEEVVRKAAKYLVSLGIFIMRGGCWKPRTSPYDFQGEGEKAVRWAIQVCIDFGIKVFVTEVVSVEADEIIDRVLDDLDAWDKVTVMRQVGTRNAQNFELLKHLGLKRNPVLLKRGMANTLEELLGAAEYILAGGNTDLVLCLRGHRLEGSEGMRFALDYRDIESLQRMTWIPVIYDPSHSTGSKDHVESVSIESLAHGAQGILVDVHPDSSIAKCDAMQALSFEEFTKYYSNLGI